MYAKQRGITLVELVMAIALSGILIVGLMTAYSSMVGRSADPMVRTQAVAIAESFLEEALLKPFLDPATAARCGGGIPTGNRENFNNVCDYNGYSSSTISLPNGAAVAGLNGYSVSISVADSADLGMAANCALKVTVTVTSPLNEAIRLVGYRTDYESESPACS